MSCLSGELRVGNLKGCHRPRVEEKSNDSMVIVEGLDLASGEQAIIEEENKFIDIEIGHIMSGLVS